MLKAPPLLHTSQCYDIKRKYNVIALLLTAPGVQREALNEVDVYKTPRDND